MGFIYPQGTPFRPAQELTMQKMFFDHMWMISLREMIDRIGDHAPPDPQRFEALAETLNDLNVRHSQELRTFELTYENEVHGILDVFTDVSIDIVEQMKRVHIGEGHTLSPEQREVEGKHLHNLLFAGFKTDATKQALRTLNIQRRKCRRLGPQCNSRKGKRCVQNGTFADTKEQLGTHNPRTPLACHHS
jgi:hypothetical protein